MTAKATPGMHGMTYLLLHLHRRDRRHRGPFRECHRCAVLRDEAVTIEAGLTRAREGRVVLDG